MKIDTEKVRKLADGHGLNLDEGNRVMLALGRGQGDEGFNEGQLAQVLFAFYRMRTMGVVAHMVLKGEMDVMIRDGEVRYTTNPSFAPEEKPDE